MITSFISHDFTYALAWTLAHSIWQISLLCLGLFMVNRIFINLNSSYKYAIALGALGCTLLLAMATFSIYYIEHPIAQSLLTNGHNHENLKQGEALHEWPLLITQNLHYIVNIWMIGVIFLMCRFLGGYMYITQLGKASYLESSSLIKKFLKLKKKYKINRTVLLKQSNKITTPLVIGFIRPVILFPVGLVNQLTPQEVTAVLAHELAHIKRYDFIFNLLQSLVESIFYYHPGIWYITKVINTERENCCDDLAIIHTEGRLPYAKTLIKLQELNHTYFMPALAMAGKNGHFSHRIRRLLQVPVEAPRVRVRVMGFVFLALIMVSFVGRALESSPVEPGVKPDLDVYIIDDCPQKIEEIKFYLDTIPERNNFHIKKRTNSQDLELEMVDGEIKQFKIDGAIINSSDYKASHTLIASLMPDDNKEVITVFPDCGKGFGNIYYLDKNRQVYRLDDILKTFDSKLRTFENFDQDKFDFHIDKFDKCSIDALLDELNSQDLSVLRTAKVKVDSVFDLLPTRLSDFDKVLTNSGFSLALPHASSE